MRHWHLNNARYRLRKAMYRLHLMRCPNIGIAVGRISCAKAFPLLTTLNALCAKAPYWEKTLPHIHGLLNRVEAITRIDISYPWISEYSTRPVEISIRCRPDHIRGSYA